jgi:two-component system, NarL family, response regulator DevR
LWTRRGPSCRASRSSPREIIELLRLAEQSRECDRETHRYVERLTTREREVLLRALADGLSDKEMSGSLHVGIGTVRNHLVSIFGKLGVNSRLQALGFALRHGIVEIN